MSTRRLGHGTRLGTSMYVHRNFLHNHPKLEIIQMLINRYMNYTVYLYNGILLRIKKEQTTDIHSHEGESQKHHAKE